MSAIAGLFSLDGRPVERADLERMANALSAHGPDRRGFLTMGEVGFAHLLMHMTPEDVFSRQPFRGPSGAVITADLRLDNRDELIAALALDRQQASTLADANIALAVWERWGDDAWARLRGPFAIAIWDARERVLTLARDQLGLNVVMWHRSASVFAFATLPKGLLALAEVPRQLNEEKFADFLVLNHAEHETTFYRDIFRLPPAHVARIDASGRMTARRYWSAEDIRPVRLGSDEAYAEAMRDHLDRAVRRQLRSAHPVGSFLSGGLDSSAVAALAARALAETGKRLSTYTQVPREGFSVPGRYQAQLDETPFVEAMREPFGTIDVNFVRSSDCDDFAELERLFHAVDGPIRNPTNAGWVMQILRLARSQNRRVLLGGDFGNVTISWDGWPQALDHLLQGRVALALRQWRLYYRQSMRSRLGAFEGLFLHPFGLDAKSLIARLRKRGSEAWQRHSAIRPEFAAEMGVEERARRVGHDFHYRNPPGTVAMRMQCLTSIDNVGDWNAGSLALTGVEARDPTSDLDVVAFCLGIPDEQYLVEGIDRSLVRRAMWGLVPPIVLTNRRKGQQAADWFEKLTARRDLIGQELSDLRRSATAQRALDIERMERAVRTWPNGGWHKARVIDEYQLALPRGLASGRFLRWFERTN